MTNMVATFITAVHLTALSQIESGDRDVVVGKSGELTRFQILPAVAAREMRENPLLRGRTFPAGWERDESLARIVALGIWEKRVATFRLAYRRDPTLLELYLCWHRPGRVLNPRPAERERAERFENLVRSNEALRRADENNQPKTKLKAHPASSSATCSVDDDVAKFKLPINLKHCGKLCKLMVAIHGIGSLRMKQEGEWLVMFRESKQPIPTTDLSHRRLVTQENQRLYE